MAREAVVAGDGGGGRGEGRAARLRRGATRRVVRATGGGGDGEQRRESETMSDGDECVVGGDQVRDKALEGGDKAKLRLAAKGDGLL